MSTPTNKPLRVRGRATLVLLLLVVPLASSLMAGAYVNHPLYKTGAPGEGTRMWWVPWVDQLSRWHLYAL